MEDKVTPRVPVNYREHRLNLFGQEIYVAAMAAPDSRQPAGAMEYVRLQSVSAAGGVIVGLRETDYTELAKKYGLEYYHLPIKDFTQAPPETYSQLYQQVKKATEEGKKITIHCGAGDGRSGTAIASLKLREIIEKAAKEDPAVLDQEQKINSSVTPSMETIAVPCSLFVKQAVEKTRAERVVSSGNSKSENGSHSVETINDINALLVYENVIKQEIKQQMGIDCQNTPSEHQENDLIMSDKFKDALIEIKKSEDTTKIEPSEEYSSNISKLD